MKLGVIEFPSCLHIASSLGYMDITSQLGKGWVPPTVIQLWNEDVAHLAAKQARLDECPGSHIDGSIILWEAKGDKCHIHFGWLHKNTQTDDFGDLLLDSEWIALLLRWHFAGSNALQIQGCNFGWM